MLEPNHIRYNPREGFCAQPTLKIRHNIHEPAKLRGKHTPRLHRRGYDDVSHLHGVDAIDNFVASVAVNPLEGLMLGVSYSSNLAGSDALQEVVADPDNLESLVGGWSAYVTCQFLDRFKLIGEYLIALDNFKAGEIYEDDTQERKPMAWNVEFGVAITDAVELAARYGGSDDGAGFLPETEYGAVLNWGFFESTNLAIEYLHGEFENDLQETDAITAQLSVEF